MIEERAGLVTVGETRYAWCGQTLCQARNGSDVELRHYFEEGEHWRLQGSRLVYVRDHLGSVRGLVRAGDGALMGAHDYDPYGRLISVSGLYPREFGYAGMHHHVSSGLWLTRYRAYDSQTARWLSRDPIEEEGGVNLYAYVGGNPLSYIDPEGLAGQTSNLGGGTSVRIDNPHVPGQQPHAHVETPKGEVVVNQDGTQSHKGKGNMGNLTNKVKDFLRGKGFRIPGIPPFLEPCVLDPYQPYCPNYPLNCPDA